MTATRHRIGRAPAAARWNRSIRRAAAGALLALIVIGAASQVAANLGNVLLVRGVLSSDAALVERGRAVLGWAADRLGQSGASRQAAAAGIILGRPAEAVDPGRRAVAADPRNLLAGYWLGRAYWDLGDREAARVVWRDSGYLERRETFLLWEGWHLTGQGQVAEAESSFRAIIALDPEAGAGYDALASLLWGGDWATVDWALERAVATYPEGSTDWHWNAGRQALRRGDWPAAAAHLGRTVADRPAEWPMRFLAEALERSGDRAGAAAVQAEIRARWGGSS